MSRLRRVAMWFWDQPWCGLLVCSIAGALNIVVAYRAESIPELWAGLLIGGWVIGWGTGSLAFHFKLKQNAITREQVYAEAEEFISQHADAWARESIRRAMAEARQHGLLPDNVDFFFADEVPPPGTKH